MMSIVEHASVCGYGILDVDPTGQLILSNEDGRFDLSFLLQSFLGTNVRFEIETDDIDIIPRGDDG